VTSSSETESVSVVSVIADVGGVSDPVPLAAAVADSVAVSVAAALASVVPVVLAGAWPADPEPPDDVVLLVVDGFEALVEVLGFGVDFGGVVVFEVDGGGGGGGGGGAGVLITGGAMAGGAPAPKDHPSTLPGAGSRP